MHDPCHDQEWLAETLSSGQRRRHLIRRLNRAVPPGRNRWFVSRQAARQAAHATARRFSRRRGAPVSVRHHVYQPLGLRHYHLAAPDGRLLRLRFFYLDVSPAALQETGGHGGRYQTERQLFLRKLLQDKSQPAFVRGWICQELKRLERTIKPTAPPLLAVRQPGPREQRLRALLARPGLSADQRQWLEQKLRRILRGKQAASKRGGGPGGSRRRLRGIPGFDVGHRQPGVHDHRRFRLENASTNRARPGIARRLGIKHIRESE
ncbi:MAG: hypothetical protein HZC41_08700 [Chloroflexi bacterium]|nr:hypothetical protein [Chloroflexota bacterium]